MQLLLCPGIHKTATSLLQRVMEDNLGVLRDSGYEVVNRRWFYRSRVWPYLRGLKGADLNGARADLAEARVTGTGRNVILSIENLFGEFSSLKPYKRTAATVERLSALFSSYHIRAIVYVRRQDQFFESAYLQNIHEGRFQHFDDFYKAFHHSDYHWIRLVTRIKKALGDEHVNVFPFEAINGGQAAYIHNFLRAIDPTLADTVPIDSAQPAATNISISGKGLEIALRSMDVLSTQEERAKLGRFLQSTYPKTLYQKPKLLTFGQRIKFAEEYSWSNKRLLEHFTCADDNIVNHYRYAEFAKEMTRHR